MRALQAAYTDAVASSYADTGRATDADRDDAHACARAGDVSTHASTTDATTAVLVVVSVRVRVWGAAPMR
jgi:hypothetical protein